MYRFWEPVVEPLLELLEPKVIVEIGSDQGFNTRNLVGFCGARGAVLHVIDPLPKYDVDEWLEQYPETMIFHRVPSLSVLESIDRADAVLIDGDHNWHTVLNELRLLIGKADSGRFPLVLLHDVGWPYGRRDLYYEPDRIPSPDRHPHRKAGLRPGRTDVDPNGGLNAHLDNAMHEGGPRNGVLTAVEDFRSEAPVDLDVVVVPGINDLGILYPTSLPDEKPAIGAVLGQLRDPAALRATLEVVERLRVESQIESSDLRREVGQLQSLAGERGSKLAAAEARVGSLATERQEMQNQLERLRAEHDRVRAEADSLKGEVRELRAVNEAEVEKNREAEIDLERSRAKLKESRQQFNTTTKKLAAAQRQYSRLRSRKSVRFALGLASLVAPVIRLLRPGARRAPVGVTSTTEASSGGPSALRGSGRKAQSRLVAAINNRRPGSIAASGPLVSIVVLTRDGAEHMRRLLTKLDEATRYRSFEVIVVDNGSSDDTAEVLEAKRRFPVKVIRNERNTSFSFGNNQGISAAEGEFVLCLNNDVEPVNPGWLGAMIEAIEADQDVVAVGAELVYPPRGFPGTDLKVQHAGIRFTLRDGAPLAFNEGGLDPLDSALDGLVEVPAVTAAALLVRREVMERVGGFDEGYVYGTEDVDLCLRLGELGRIVVTGQAVLFHHESATQTQIAAEVTLINRKGNRQRLVETWGPRLSRSVRRERLSGSGTWIAARPRRRVAITLTEDDIEKGWGDYYTAHELGDAFVAAGWDVVYAERYQDRWYDIRDEVDLVIALLDSYDVRQAPDGAFTVAWVRNWVDRWLEQPWLENYDLVVSSSHKAARLLSNGSRYQPVVVPLATNPRVFYPGVPHPTFECDYAFTGNNWGPGRKLIRMLDVHPEDRFMLFGKGWEKEPRVARYWRGHLDYELLPELYRSTKIVLDDTATPTLPYGFVNGRVFDALAAGALVLSDNVEGSGEMFEGLLPTYFDREGLRDQLDRYLTNEAERLELVSRLQRIVSSRHDYASRPGEFLSLALAHLERPHAAIKIAVPNEEVKLNWGDTHFAGALANSLTQLGVPTEVHILPEWDDPAKQGVDVVIHLRGLTSYAPKPAQLNVMWIISHPDDVSTRECEKYDLVLVASRPHAEWLQAQIDVPVVFMPQATDGRRFMVVEPNDELASEVLFVGNSRRQRRPAVDWAIRQGLPLTVYGSGWGGRIPSQFVRAEHFPNEELASLYASSKVVLNDHWPDMRDSGFISNRIFDALASGSVVVSDRAAGLDEMFGDLVPTYSDPRELEEVVRGLLDDAVRRKEISEAASRLVADKHTFDQRVEQLMGLVRPLLSGRNKDLEAGVFEFDRL